MIREYQARRMKDYVLPEAVYRQALWATKDLNRLKDELNKTMEDVDTVSSHSFINESMGQGLYSDITAKKAERLVILSSRIDSIESALFYIPERYRNGISRKLHEGNDFGDEFHPNTWKKWQQVYIYHVAKNLGLI
ncbi:MAG: hypothetical protein IKU67_04905 [Firmicutes bacterium]|nr:hypothetical protein [Bacillota bacterium]